MTQWDENPLETLDRLAFLARARGWDEFADRIAEDAASATAAEAESMQSLGILPDETGETEHPGS